MMAVSAQAGVISTATGTHSLEIVSVAGDGAADLFIEAFLNDAFEAVDDGEGSSLATALVDGIGPLSIGDRVESSVTAIAERRGEGVAISEAGIEVDIEFFLDRSAQGPVKITVDYARTITAGVNGSGPLRFGFAASFTDFFSVDVPADVVTEVRWDSEFYVGDGNGTPVDIGSDVPGAFDFSLEPGESALVFLDAGVIAFAAVDPNVIPEPNSFAVWCGLGLVAMGARRRRSRRNRWIKR
jgi:hypothetical protein